MHAAHPVPPGTEPGGCLDDIFAPASRAALWPVGCRSRTRREPFNRAEPEPPQSPTALAHVGARRQMFSGAHPATW